MKRILLALVFLLAAAQGVFSQSEMLSFAIFEPAHSRT